jgi:hypothetical protein
MTGMQKKRKGDDRALTHSPVAKNRCVVLDDDRCLILDFDDVSHNLPPTPGMPGLLGCKATAL